MNHGILGDPAKWEELSRRPANSNDWVLGPDDPLRAAIEESNRCREVEMMRVHLAHALRGVFDDELEAQHGRLLALPEKVMRARKAAFAAFRGWCLEEGLPSLPSCPECVAHYVVHLAAKDLPAKKLEQIVEAIRWVHQLADMGQRRLPGHCDFDAPVIRAALVWVDRCWTEDAARIAEAAAKQTTTTTNQPKRKGKSL
jgi:hypothetical protein